MNYIPGYQEYELPTALDTFIPRLVMPPEADPSLQPPGAYQIVNLDPTLSPNATISTPSSPHSQHGQRVVTCSLDTKIQKHKSQTAKGRMQNREAQRRFRGRKEELQQKLQRQATELEAQCQELSKGFCQKSEEVSEIIKEKEALTSEIQDLRKRWRVMLMLLQLPDRLQSLSSLLGNDLSSPSGSSPSSSSSPSTTKSEPLDVPLDELLGCLQELLLPTL
ncbi:bZIP transcription factor bZIP-1 [Penicillium subrubescens]|nr:bZIP transcription factor bZIP-1 [Penicillium subrubescens]KAJ5896630.1 bZIP transcription factor bZIP-1 [Penicillium subrubescens]